MKRILIFSLNYYPRFIGGAEVALKEITDRIDPEEITFHMVTLRFDSNLPREEQVGNVMVHRIGPVVKNPSIADLRKFPLHYSKHLYQFLAVVAAERLHREYRFDGIWAMMAHSCAIPAGIFKKRHPEVKYLLTLQEGDPPAQIEATMKPAWGLFVQGFKRADVLQPISTFLRTWGERMGFTGVVEVIPNAVDTEKFSQRFADADIQQMKQRLGKQEGDVYMITTSRLVHKNAIDDVISAVSLLPKHISFLIYGIGPDEEKLRTLAEELGVADRVRFMGQVSHEELPLVLAACDIFIRPSRSEGMGNSFVEAMAAGLPVIATQEGGIADFLFDKERNPDKEATGWAVDVDSPKQIVDAVTRILENPEDRVHVTETARRMVMTIYDWNHIAASMRALFANMFR